MANLIISNKPRCVNPTLISVIQTSNNTVSIVWNNHAVNYNNGIVLFEISIDGGASYFTVATLNTSELSANVTSNSFNNVSNGQVIKYRITVSGGNCQNMVSNIIDGVWVKNASISIVNIQDQNTDGETYAIKCFTLRVQEAPFQGYLNLVCRADTNNNTKILSVDVSVHDVQYIQSQDNTNYNKEINDSVSYPVGDHELCLRLENVTLNPEHPYHVQGAVNFSTVSGYNNAITENIEVFIVNS